MLLFGKRSTAFSPKRPRQQGHRSLQDELTPEEWVRQFDTWVDSHDRTTPLLSDEAVSRESIYPDRV
jgi:hypothetical protein